MRRCWGKFEVPKVAKVLQVPKVTEVYSNTGGQMSKSTPRAATAQFAAGGKKMPKKDIGMIFSTYGNVYVAKIAMGANPVQVAKAIAEAYDGPSLIIAYSHCINHGIDMAKGFDQQTKAVKCGHWPLYRYNPELEKEGKNPLHLDSKALSIPSRPSPETVTASPLRPLLLFFCCFLVRERAF